MVIDCHGHYTTVPRAFDRERDNLIAKLNGGATGSDWRVPITDDEIRLSLDGGQVKYQDERGINVTLFSPRPSRMVHHLGNPALSLEWARSANNLIHRVSGLYPSRFVGICELPQAAGAPPAHSIGELERAVTELGMVGCNLNPDPSAGYWTGPPLTDRAWYPLYDKMVELEVPAMIHASASCNPNFHTAGVHYLNADTAVFMQCLAGNLFNDFPTLRFVIPHGGGAAAYHWGRYRGIAQDLGQPPLDELIRNNVFFDTCVYHQAGIDLLLRTVPVDNILFGSEMIGAVRSVDPETGHHFDDTKRYLEQATSLDVEGRRKIMEDNARKVYPRLTAALPDPTRVSPE